MLMTEKKPPTRVWAIVLWVALIMGMVWLASLRPVASQESEAEPHGDAAEIESQMTDDFVPPGNPVFMDIAPPRPFAGADPLELYPDGIEFDAYRKGSRVGKHKVSFKRNGDLLIVETEFKLKVKVLFITAYKFLFESTGVWKDGVLQTMDVSVDDNGKDTKVDAYLSEEDGKFYVTGRKGDFVGTDWVYPTNHWNAGVLGSKVVLNTLNGALANVEILRQGIETIETKKGTVDAERIEYTGELRDTTVWYDSAGRWVKMVFTTKSGETVEYVCRECGLSESEDQISDAR